LGIEPAIDRILTLSNRVFIGESMSATARKFWYGHDECLILIAPFNNH
jgi:hypothetical protein